jgi:hypothetical protein
MPKAKRHVAPVAEHERTEVISITVRGPRWSLPPRSGLMAARAQSDMLEGASLLLSLYAARPPPTLVATDLFTTCVPRLRRGVE